MKAITYLESLGFVDVTEQIKSEIKSNAKVTKAMEYVLNQIDNYKLRFVINPEHIGEKNVIFFEYYRANYKYICEVIEKKTSFTPQLPERIQKFEEIHLDAWTLLPLKSKFGFSIENILEAWEFFLTGNPELPHHIESFVAESGRKYVYEKYPQIYREKLRECER